jgi:hypothetical protein
MRLRSSFVLAAVTAALLAVPPSAGVAAHQPALPGRQRVEAFHDLDHARLVFRDQHPARAVAAPDNAERGLAFSATLVKQISRDKLPATNPIEPDTQVEPDIDVDPNNPQHVVAAVQNGRDPNGGAQTIAYATSHDGGTTWVTKSLPGVTTQTGGAYDRASDPAVAFGPDGSVYAVSLVFNTNNNSDGVAVSRSADGGVTWAQPVLAQSDNSGTDDKEWITVDDFPSSPHFGRIYVVWDASSFSGQPTYLRYSDDQGQTWSARVTVSSASALTIGARPVVQPNGNVTIVYENFGAGTIVAQTSSNGGSTFSSAVTVAADRASDPTDERAGSDLPSVAVDPTTGAIDVVWGDTRFRSDGTMDAVLSRSTDGGSTWSAPVRTNQDSTTDGLTHMTPAVAAHGGSVYVTYRTRQKSGTSYSNLVGMAVIGSTDGGLTFGGEIPVGRRSDLTWAAQARGKFLGDYMGLAASASAVHPVWCRAFQPQTAEQYHQTTWSASVS